MQTITLAGVKSAALKAHAEGRLLAQSGFENYGYEVMCNGKTSVCAIGASLTREALDQIEAHGLQRATIKLRRMDLRSIFDFADEEFPALFDIQRAHDGWLYSVGDNDKKAIADREELFLYLLNA